MSKLCGNFPLPFPLVAGMGAIRGTLSSALMSLPQQGLQLIRGSLRTKFILLIVSLEIVLMGAVTFVVEGNQRRAILEQTRLRAVSLGTNLAALSEGYLLSYNFVKLEQTIRLRSQEKRPRRRVFQNRKLVRLHWTIPDKRYRSLLGGHLPRPQFHGVADFQIGHVIRRLGSFEQHLKLRRF